MRTIKSSWVIDDTFNPTEPNPPINAPASCRTMAAGNKVRRGATTERKMKTSRMMISNREASWVSLPCLSDWAWLATAVASCPAKCT